MQPQTQPMDTRAAYRVNDFCAAFGISRTTVYKLAKQKKLRLVKIAGRVLVPASEGQRLLNGDARA